MLKFSTLRLAKKQCSSKVKEQGRVMKCLDSWREVIVNKRGKVLTIKCLSHGHKSRGKEKTLLNQL